MNLQNPVQIVDFGVNFIVSILIFRHGSAQESCVHSLASDQKISRLRRGLNVAFPGQLLVWNRGFVIKKRLQDAPFKNGPDVASELVLQYLVGNELLQQFLGVFLGNAANMIQVRKQCGLVSRQQNRKGIGPDFIGARAGTMYQRPVRIWEGLVNQVAQMHTLRVAQCVEADGIQGLYAWRKSILRDSRLFCRLRKFGAAQNRPANAVNICRNNNGKLLLASPPNTQGGDASFYGHLSPHRAQIWGQQLRGKRTAHTQIRRPPSEESDASVLMVWAGTFN